MRVVWLLNGALPSIIEKEKLGGGSVGWAIQLANMISQEKDIELVVFFPQNKARNVIRGEVGDIRYIGFYESPIAETRYNKKTERLFRNELKKLKPDIVHIWGTEYVHTLCMVNAFDNPEKTVISIQGLVSICGEKYEKGLPKEIIKRYTIRDFIRHDSILDQKHKFLKRGQFEIEALKRVKHVVGRTDWDKKTVLSINPNLKYHYGREILRSEFYSSRKWSYDNCEKHSIFMSQAYYPIKGMHFAVEIVRLLKEKHPDVRLYVTGKDVFPIGIKDKLKQDSYSEYIKELIEKYELRNNIVYLGSLSAQQMIKQYLKANVFLQASIMENSPNSLGEAMILGAPCVASDVGGTSSMANNGESAYLYNYIDTNEAANYIFRIFDDAKMKERLSINAVEQANDLYQIDSGCVEYLYIYKTIINGG